MPSKQPDVSTIVLAGGKGQRMGGVNKGLIKLNGKTFIEHAITAIAPQSSEIIISANHDIPSYQQWGYPLCHDIVPDQGPLGGIMSAGQLCHNEWIMTVPCDLLAAPATLIQQLLTAALQSHCSCVFARDKVREHYTVNLFHRSVLGSIAVALQQQQRALGAWLKSQTYQTVLFTEQETQLWNINTPAALNKLKASSVTGEQ